MGISIESRRGWFACQVCSDPRENSGGKATSNSSFSPRFVLNVIAEDGCALLHTSVFPESRMHNERCTSGSEGEHRSPMAAMPHGADARPYPSCWGRRSG